MADQITCPPELEGAHSAALSDAGVRGLLGYNLKRAYMVFVPRNHAALGALGLKVQGFTCLSLIDENPDLTPSELADYLRMERSNLVTLLADLTQRGWVDRARAHSDRRRIALRLTEAGRATYHAAQAALHQSEEEALVHLSVKERAQLNKLLSKIEAHMPANEKDKTT